MPRRDFNEGTTRSGESAEVNVSDHEYEVEHNKHNRPEISRGGRGKQIIIFYSREQTTSIEAVSDQKFALKYVVHGLLAFFKACVIHQYFRKINCITKYEIYLYSFARK